MIIQTGIKRITSIIRGGNRMMVKDVTECLKSNDIILDEVSKQIGLILQMDKEKVKSLLYNSPSQTVAKEKLIGMKSTPSKELEDLIELFEKTVYHSQHLNRKKIR